MASTVAIFIASLRSVGTATTPRRRGDFTWTVETFISLEEKRPRPSFAAGYHPSLPFLKIVYCPQDKSPEPCPSFTDDLRDIWMLLFLPLFVVGCGLLVGWAASKLSSTPARQKRVGHGSSCIWKLYWPAYHPAYCYSGPTSPLDRILVIWTRLFTSRSTFFSIQYFNGVSGDGSFAPVEDESKSNKS